MRRLILVVFFCSSMWALDWKNLSVFQNLEEVRLSNGLVVYLKRDETTPLVFVSVNYRVGFRHEGEQEKGYTHLLEHMMFRGTTNYSASFFRKKMMEEGVEYNAHTTPDMTFYHSLAPFSALETILMLEADRMQNLLISEEDFVRERGVVYDELLGLERSPSYQLYMKVLQKALGEHPLSWLGGYGEDIKRASRESLVRLYRTYYVPNNAYLVIVGNFDRGKVMAMVRKYFGSLCPSSSLPVERIQPPLFRPGLMVSLQGPARSHFGALFFVFSGVNYTNREYQMLFLLDSAGMVRNLNIDFALDATIVISPYQDKPFFLGTMIQKEYLEKEIDQARSRMYNTMKIQMTDMEVLGMWLSQKFRYGTLSEVKDFYASLDTITADELYQFLRTNFVSSRAASGYFTAIRFDPALQWEDVSFMTSERILRNGTGEDVFDGREREQQKFLHENTYRMVRSSYEQLFSEVKRKVLSNGMVVLFLKRKGGVVSLVWAFRDDRFRREKPYQRFFLQWYLYAGGPHIKFQRLIEANGGIVLPELVVVDTNDYANAIKMIGLMLKDRKIYPLVLEEEKEKKIIEFMVKKKRPDSLELATKMIHQALLEPLATVDDYATPQSILSLSVKDEEEMYRALYRPENMVLAIVGDVDDEKAYRLVEKEFGGWTQASSSLPLASGVFKKNERPVTVALRMGGDQANVWIAGRWGVSYTNTRDWIYSRLLNSLFGEHTSQSRLVLRMREKEGMTYSVETTLEPLSTVSGETLYRCEFTTSRQNISKLLAIYEEERNRLIQEGPSEIELLQHKCFFYTTELMNFRHLVRLAETLVYNEARRGNYTYTLYYLDTLYGASCDDIRSVAPKAFPVKTVTVIGR